MNRGFSLGVSIFCFILMVFLYIKGYIGWAIVNGVCGIINMYFAFSGVEEK